MLSGWKVGSERVHDLTLTRPRGGFPISTMAYRIDMVRKCAVLGFAQPLVSRQGIIARSRTHRDPSTATWRSQRVRLEPWAVCVCMVHWKILSTRQRYPGVKSDMFSTSLPISDKWQARKRSRLFFPHREPLHPCCLSTQLYFCTPYTIPFFFFPDNSLMQMRRPHESKVNTEKPPRNHRCKARASHYQAPTTTACLVTRPSAVKT